MELPSSNTAVTVDRKFADMQKRGKTFQYVIKSHHFRFGKSVLIQAARPLKSNPKICYP